MKLSWKREILSLAMLTATAVIGLHYYSFLPDTVASHYDIHGRPNGYMPKTLFILVMGGAVLFIYLLLTFLPLIDPFKKKIEVKFKNVLLLRDASVVFFVVLFTLSLQAARAGILNVDLFGIAFGVLLIVIGNYMPKIPQNFFLGIRTPWTIISEVVWKKTHIVGGWLFVLSGVIYLVCAALKINSVIPLSGIVVASLVSVAYSFFLYEKMQKD